MSELDDIRAFVEIVDAGSLSRAARRLGLSKSIVSRRLARLETRLGGRLLSRTTHGISPTEAGAEFKRSAERILADLEEACGAVAQRGDEVIGLLRVAVPLSFGLRHVAPLLAELATRHPKLRIDAAYAERAVDLIAEGFDAAVRLGRLKDSSLIARRIAPIRRAVVASPGYLARHGCPETPGDLARHELLMRPDQSNSAVWQFRAAQRLISVRPEGRFKADNGEAILQAAVAGLGIAALPTFLVSPAIESGTLTPLLPNYPLTEASLFLVRPPGTPVPGKVRALTDFLLERFGGEPYWDACQVTTRRPS